MNCKNCDTSFLTETNYCSYCGAKVIHNRLTVGNIFEDFSTQFLNYDNRFLQTYIGLFKRPKDVINGYVTGTRKKYINVLNYIALAITISGAQYFLLGKFFPEAMKFPDYLSNGNPMGEGIMTSIMEYYSLWYVVLIPLYALLSRMVFYNINKYNYVEHIVIMGYTQAHLSITLFIPTVFLSILGYNFFSYNYLFIGAMILYSAYCYKRLYDLSLKRIIVKTFVFFGVGLLAYILILILVLITMLVYLWATDGMQDFIESQKQVSYIASSVINWTS